MKLVENELSPVETEKVIEEQNIQKGTSEDLLKRGSIAKKDDDEKREFIEESTRTQIDLEEIQGMDLKRKIKEREAAERKYQKAEEELNSLKERIIEASERRDKWSDIKEQKDAEIKKIQERLKSLIREKREDIKDLRIELEQLENKAAELADSNTILRSDSGQNEN